MLLVVDPGCIDFRVLLFLLTWCLGIVCPEREIFAVVADGESGNVNCNRLRFCICWFLVIFLFIGLGRGWRIDRIFILRDIDEWKDLEIVG